MAHRGQRLRSRRRGAALLRDGHRHARGLSAGWGCSRRASRAAASARGICSPRDSRSTSRRSRRSCGSFRAPTSGGRSTASGAATNVLAFTVLNEGFAAEFAARANTALNLLMFGGGFAAQWGIGLVVDAARAALGVDTRRAGSRSRLRSCWRSTCSTYAWFAWGWRRHAPVSHVGGRHARQSADVTRAMHLHILGICGTFMGGIAAIAQARRAQGDRLRRQRLSADEHAARGARHRAHRGLRRRAARRASRAARTCSSSATRSRAATRSSRRSSTPGCPTSRGRSGSSSTCSHDKWVLAVAGTHGKTTTTSMLAWILEHAGLESGLPDRRRAAQFRRLRAAHRQRVLRDRGRRIRHRVLRQALEVRPLPAAHRDPQQPRVRPRRHLRRPRRDRDAVPSLRPHGAAVGPARRQRARSAALARVLARGCWSEVERFAGAEFAASGGATERPSGGSTTTARVLRGAPQGTLRWPARRPQLGRHNRLNALAALAAARHAGVPTAAGLAALAEFDGIKRRLESARDGGRRHRLRRFRAPSDGDRDDGRRAAARGGRARASSRCWSRARTR